MGTIGIISKILILIIRIGIIGYTLADPELKIPFKKIKVVVGV